MKTFRIIGRIVDTHTRHAAAGLRVEAWDKDLFFDDLLGEAITDAKGAFEIEFQERHFREVIERRPDLIFKIFKVRTLVASAPGSVPWDIESGMHQVELEVDLPSAALQVSGSVITTAGEPINRATVRIFTKRVREERLLAEAKTDLSGLYAATADIPVGGTDVIARVFDDNDQSIAASPIYFKAAGSIVLDLLVPPDAKVDIATEYERFVRTLEPFFERDGAADFSDLSDDDVLYLSGVSGLDPEPIAFLSAAYNLMASTAVPAAAWYALARMDFHPSLESLSQVEPSTIRSAIRRAAADRIIPQEFADAGEAVIATLQKTAIEDALKPSGGNSSPLAKILEHSLPDADDRREFLEGYASHNGTMKDFWATLAENSRLSVKRVAETKEAMQLSIVTRNNLPLVAQLQQRRKKGTWSEIRDLAGLEEQDWLELVEASGVPDDLPYQGEDRARRYAAAITDFLAHTYPTAAIATRLGKRSESKLYSPELIDFFTRNKDFDIRRRDIDEFVSTHAKFGRKVDAAAKQTVAGQLKTIQRLFAVTPRFEQIDALAAAGFDSAARIARMGKSHFQRKYASQVGGTKVASKIYDIANERSATAVALLANYSEQFTGLTTMTSRSQSALMGSFAQEAGLPQLRDLFGSLDFCDCKHCRSVFSPAAYLVDTLAFLEKRDSKRPKQNNPAARVPVVDILLERRPDIQKIKLTCENTNTPLPQIDLVNEVLELAVIKQADAAQTDTLGTAAELAAHPQHIYRDAYDPAFPHDNLAKVVFPWAFPFDLWAEEARVYLRHLGVQRHELIEALHTGTRAQALRDPAFVAESLGLTKIEYDILTDAPLDPTRFPVQPNLRKYWGYAANASNWVSDLGKLPEFMRRSGLTLPETIELFDTWFIDPANNTYDLDGPQSSSNIDDLKIRNFTNGSAPAESAIGRIYKFLRLRRALGCTIRELDRLFDLLFPRDNNGNAALTSANWQEFLRRVAHLRRAQELVTVDAMTAASWWSTLQTRRYETEHLEKQSSLYDDIFLSRSVGDPQNSIFRLRADRTELNDTTQKVGGHIAAVIGALGITADELAELARFELNANDLANLNLQLNTLTALYRAATLAKALQVSVRDYMSLRQLTGINPFVASQSQDLVRFIEFARKVAASGVTIGELDYILRHELRPGHVETPTATEIGVVLEEIRQGLRAIDADTARPLDEAQAPQPLPDATGEFTLKKLAAIIDGKVAERIVRILREEDEQTVKVPPAANWNALPSALRDRIAYDSATQDLRFTGVLTTAELPLLEAQWHAGPERAKITALYSGPRTLLEQQLAPITPAGVNIATQLLDSGKTITQRFDYVLTNLLPYLRRELSTRLVAEKTATNLKLDNVLTRKLLTDWLKSSANAANPAIDDLLSVRALNSVPAPTNAADAFNTFVRLDKTARIINGFRFTEKEVAWAFRRGIGRGWLDFNQLPIAPVNAPQFDSWLRVFDYKRTRDAASSGEPEIIDLLERAHTQAPGTVGDMHNDLEKRMGWRAEDLTFLSAGNRFAINFPDSYKDEAKLARLIEVFGVLKRLGVSAEEAWPWKAAEVTEGAASAIKQATKAKYDTATWLKVAGPLRDVLREKQRTALVAFLLAYPQGRLNAAWLSGHPLREANDLYEYFLIDVETGPCVMTSRIRQATSAVQQFVQRTLLNLEPEVKFDPVDAREWSWMKQYRVWEANRKVFCMPENWLEPELRDDKTPIFKELESELLQKDIVDETAEEAFLNYLRKLDEVARLEVVGMYHQVETADGERPELDVIHVVARSAGTPPVYYYRKLQDTVWSPWEKMEVEIESEQVIPVIHNRRLYVFWPVLMEQATETTTQRLPDRNVEIRLGWTERKNQSWTARRLSKSTIETATPKEQLWFKAIADQDTGDLLITPFGYYDNGFFLGLKSFRFSGSDGTVTLDDLTEEEWGYWPTPADIDIDHQQYVADGRFTPLVLPYSDNIRKLSTTGEVLGAPPAGFNARGKFNLVYPHASQITDGEPFFFQDRTRSFFVVPHGRTVRDTVLVSGGYTPMDEPHPDLTEIIDLFECEFPKGGGPGPGPDPQPWSSNNQYMMPGDGPRTGTTTYPVQPHGDFCGGPGAGPNPVANMSGAHHMIARSHAGHTPAQGADGTGGTGGGVMMMAKTKRWGGGKWSNRGRTVLVTKQHWEMSYSFSPFYHPFVRLFARELYRGGIDELLHLPLQLDPYAYLQGIYAKEELNFGVDYNPKAVELPYPVENVDFDGGAYAQYNWELFFHAPLLIADKLCRNQRFAEAQNWYHYIFNPTDASTQPGPRRFWRTKPLFEYEAGLPIQDLLKLLKTNLDDPAVIGSLPANVVASLKSAKADLQRQITEMRKNPFNPHAIARHRRSAYQRFVVMRYLDNLIAWGDQLFRRDTVETLNEATQLYVLASDLLGRRPILVPSRVPDVPKSFEELRPNLDEFSNAVIALENQLPLITVTTTQSDSGVPAPVSLLGPTLYFCVPKNEKLLGYWDTVADRLFKIRNCMNIEGVVRQLPLFEPPIDPAMLVRAAAAGVSIDSALNAAGNAAMPHYRFSTMLQKAVELANELKSLGGALLGALEKRDAEELSLIRSAQEIRVLEAAKQVRSRQVDDAKNAIGVIQKQRAMTEVRHDFYRDIEHRSSYEKMHIEALGIAQIFQVISQATELVVPIVSLIPNFQIGANGMASPIVAGQFGGDNVGAAVQAFGRAMSILGSIASYQANMASILGGWERRSEEWKLQHRIAVKELEHLDKQMIGAEIRAHIAEIERANHELQIENAKSAEEFMRYKFTNRQLYEWQISQISRIFFQTYQLAFDVAKQAERTFRYESGDENASFIQPAYWDSLKKGLLAGEQLFFDLKRMENGYFERNKREHEVTKHVSLALLDPFALAELKATGECFVNLPEALFDLDKPGQYFRRIKSVALTIPSITGPYSGVNCTLTLVRNSMRVSTAMNANSYTRADSEDPRFRDAVGSIQSIVTSSGQNDSGLFETNLRDERYLPFEGAGAISQWRIQVPRNCNAFDTDTIADIIMHIRYTARDGGDAFRGQVIQAINNAFPKFGVRMFSARADFANEWAQFTKPGTDQQTRALTMHLSPERLAAQFRVRNFRIERVQVALRVRDGVAYNPLQFQLKPGTVAQSNALTPQQNTVLGNVPYANVDYSQSPQNLGAANQPWLLSVDRAALQNAQLEDIVLLYHYRVT